MISGGERASIMGMMGDARGKATESLLIMCLIKTGPPMAGKSHSESRDRGPEAVIEFDKTAQMTWSFSSFATNVTVGRNHAHGVPCQLSPTAELRELALTA